MFIMIKSPVLLTMFTKNILKMFIVIGSPVLLKVGDAGDKLCLQLILSDLDWFRFNCRRRGRECHPPAGRRRPKVLKIST